MDEKNEQKNPSEQNKWKKIENSEKKNHYILLFSFLSFSYVFIYFSLAMFSFIDAVYFG